MSSEVDKGLNDALLRQLECPVCLDCCLHPIYMCVNGHNVCSSCRDQVTECVTCLTPGRPSLRNFFAEGISAQVKFPCMNYEEDCQGMFNMADMAEHLPRCEEQFSYECRLSVTDVIEEPQPPNLPIYVPPMQRRHVIRRLALVPPPVTPVPVATKQCTWKGRRSELAAHVEQLHGLSCHTSDVVVEMACRVATPTTADDTVSDVVCKLVSAHGRLFWCVFEFCPQMSAYVGHVSCVAGKSAAENYAVQMLVSSPCGSQRLTYCGKTLRLEDKPTRCLYVHQDMVGQFLEEGELKCKIQILRA